MSSHGFRSLTTTDQRVFIEKANVMDTTSYILMIEDNPGDIRLTQEYFNDHKLVNNLTIVNDCIEALSFLRRQEAYAQATGPDIILGSFHVLILTEDRVLKQLQDEVTLQNIPIVGLTDSVIEADWIGDNLPINFSVTKPLTLEKTLKIVKHFGNFKLALF